MRRLRRAGVLAVVVLALSIGVYGQAKRTEKAEKAKDPVCGMMVDKNPDLAHDHKGQTYYFCSRADMEDFKKSPDKFVKK